MPAPWPGAQPAPLSLLVPPCLQEVARALARLVAPSCPQRIAALSAPALNKLIAHFKKVMQVGGNTELPPSTVVYPHIPTHISARMDVLSAAASACVSVCVCVCVCVFVCVYRPTIQDSDSSARELGSAGLAAVSQGLAEVNAPEASHPCSQHPVARVIMECMADGKKELQGAACRALALVSELSHTHTHTHTYTHTQVAGSAERAHVWLGRCTH